MSGLPDLRRKYDVKRGERAAARAARKSIKTELRSAKRSAADLSEAHEALRISSELVQKEVREKVEGLVTEGLHRVFHRDERFYFEIEVKRGRMTAVPMIERTINGVSRVGEVRRCFGGGVTDVTAFLLQIVFLVLTPGSPRIFIADEPFRNVSRDFLPRVAEMLEWLRDVTKIQFIIVTHQPEIAAVADKEFRVTQNADGMSEIEVA